MYSKKSVRPRIDPWGTPALTGYYSEDLPSRTIRNRLLLRKEEIRPNVWPEYPYDLSLWRRRARKTIFTITPSLPKPLKKTIFTKPVKNLWGRSSYEEDHLYQSYFNIKKHLALVLKTIYPCSFLCFLN